MNIINIIYRSPTVVKDDNLDRSPFYPYPISSTDLFYDETLAIISELKPKVSIFLY